MEPIDPEVLRLISEGIRLARELAPFVRHLVAYLERWRREETIQRRRSPRRDSTHSRR